MKKAAQIFKDLNFGVVSITMVYLAFGLSWIIFSDGLVLMMYPDASADTLTSIQTTKGWVFILITTLLLFGLLLGFAAKLRKAIKEQQESGTDLKKMIDALGVSIARLDTKGRFIAANPDCCQYFGFTEEQLLKKTLFDLTYPDDVAQEEKCWEKLLNRKIESITLQKRFLNNLNQVIWADEKLTIAEDANRDPKYVTLVIHNLNAAKETERKLEKSLRYYQAVLENSFDGVSIVGKDGNIKYQTPSVERLTGYSPEKRMGESALSMVIAEDQPKVQLILNELLTNQAQNAQTVVRLLKPNNTYTYLEIKGTNLLNDPVIEGIVANFRDITDKYSIENKLQESEEQYKLLFLHNPIPMFIYNPTSLKYLQVNDAAVKQYGYTREEFLTMNLKDMRPIEDIPKVLEDIALIDSGQQERSQIWRHLTKGKQIKYVEIAAVNIHYNGQKARMSIANDVTNIITNQENIRQSEERYRHLVENLPAGAVLVQAETLYFNKAVAEITGYNLDEISTLNMWFEKLYHQDAAMIRQFYDEDKAKNFGAARTVSIITKGGVKRWVTFYAYRFETGEVWLIQDITEKKKMDELIISSILEAEDKERKRIAEELHDGLGHLLVTAQLKVEELKETMAQLPESEQDLLKNCHDFLNQAIAETRAIASNLIPLTFGEESIQLTLENLFVNFQKTSGIALHFYHDEQIPALSASNANNIYRIAQEALNNILKHSKATNVNINLFMQENELRFVIKDNGIGYDPNSIPMGSMGLTNMRNRVIAMGGEINTEAKPGQGTIIEIAVPIAKI